MASTSSYETEAAFSAFYSEVSVVPTFTLNQLFLQVKAIESRDAQMTSAAQLHRLTKPGSKYLNLNPFEVLQVEPEASVDERKKQFKKLSLLLHPDKNPDDRDRAKVCFDREFVGNWCYNFHAFTVLKKAMETLDDPDELDRYRNICLEAKARLEMDLREKRKEAKKKGQSMIDEDHDPEKLRKSLWIMTVKVFADRERKRGKMEQRVNEET